MSYAQRWQCQQFIHIYVGQGFIPANKQHQPDFGLLLAHRLRRWTNIELKFGEQLLYDVTEAP